MEGVRMKIRLWREPLLPAMQQSVVMSVSSVGAEISKRDRCTYGHIHTYEPCGVLLDMTFPCA